MKKEKYIVVKHVCVYIKHKLDYSNHRGPILDIYIKLVLHSYLNSNNLL